MKFRKKPIVIEAMQLTRNFAERVVMWIQENGGEIPEFNLGEFNVAPPYIEIKTLEGLMIVNENDWVVKGIENEFHPVREDIFIKTYERVYE